MRLVSWTNDRREETYPSLIVGVESVGYSFDLYRDSSVGGRVGLGGTQFPPVSLETRNKNGNFHFGFYVLVVKFQENLEV